MFASFCLFILDNRKSTRGVSQAKNSIWSFGLPDFAWGWSTCRSCHSGLWGHFLLPSETRRLVLASARNRCRPEHLVRVDEKVVEESWVDLQNPVHRHLGHSGYCHSSSHQAKAPGQRSSRLTLCGYSKPNNQKTTSVGAGHDTFIYFLSISLAFMFVHYRQVAQPVSVATAVPPWRMKWHL